MTLVEPKRPVLVFDGDCGFCTTSANFGHRHFGVDIVPWQQADLDAFGLTPDACQTAVQWVASDGAVTSGAAAVASVLRAGPRWSRPLGYVLDLPGIRSLAAMGYTLVARYRYRLPGATAACRIDASRPVPGTRRDADGDQ